MVAKKYIAAMNNYNCKHNLVKCSMQFITGSFQRSMVILYLNQVEIKVCVILYAVKHMHMTACCTLYTHLHTAVGYCWWHHI